METIESERRKKLVLISCPALILRCLEEGLYPCWDAHDMRSVHLAEKFGYKFDHEYTAYEVASNERTHSLPFLVHKAKLVHNQCIFLG